MAALPIRGPVDHAMANPPYHAAHGTRSPLPSREAAKRADTDPLPAWIEALARPLRSGGTLTLILPPWLLESCLSAMRAARTPGDRVFPIRPRPGQRARWVVVQGRRHGRAPLVLDAGLSLHEASGAFRPEAEAVLRDAAPLFPPQSLNGPVARRAGSPNGRVAEWPVAEGPGR